VNGGFVKIFVRTLLSAGLAFQLGACSLVVNHAATESQQPPKTAPLLGGLSSFSNPEARFSSDDSAHRYFECKASNESSWSLCSSPYDLSDLLPERGDEITLQVRSANATGSTGPTSEKLFRRGYPSATVNEYLNTVHVLPDDSYIITGSFTGIGGVAVKGIMAMKSDGTYSSIFENIDPGYVYKILKQSDGKILIVGDFQAYNSQTPGLSGIVRLNADLSVDTTFVTNAGTGFDNPVRDVALQSDGKIIAGGQFTSYDGDASAPDNIIRLNADGSEDLTFRANAGVGFDNQVFSLAVQSDDKIVVGGWYGAYAGNAATPQSLARLNADGSEDTTFRTNAGVGPDNRITALAIQGDGKILIGGYFSTYAGNASAPERIARLNVDGSEDTTFRTNAGGGFNNGANNGVEEIVIQDDGKILVGGTFNTYGGNASAPDNIIRLNADGTEDTAFRANAGSGFDAGVIGIYVQDDDKILIGGESFDSYDGSPTPHNLLRLNSDGSVDSSFSATVKGGFQESVATFLQLDDETIVSGGDLVHFGNDADAPDGIARFNADGSEDTGFLANAGAGIDSFVSEIAAQSDGKLIMGGGFTTYAGDSATPNGILRLNADGSEDLTFRTNANSGFNGPVHALAVQSDDQIIVGGSFTNYRGIVATPGNIARLSADGVVDNSFTNNIVMGFDAPIYALAIQADGKILVGGQFTSLEGDAGTPDYIVRLNADGTEDLSFRAIAGSGFDSYVDDIVIQDDGKILVAGWFENYNGANISNGVARLNADGSSDTTFNSNFGTGAGDGLYAMALQNDGKIVGVGYFSDYNGDADAPNNLIRLNSNGSEDLTFRTNVGEGLHDWGEDIAVDSQGRILAGGDFSTFNAIAGLTHFVRLFSDGSLFD
jgi:uncharacterized delta-60 repeat protein